LNATLAQTIDYLGLPLTTYAVGEGAEKTFYVLAAELFSWFEEPQNHCEKQLR
jgi:hypothetical protein